MPYDDIGNVMGINLEGSLQLLEFAGICTVPNAVDSALTTQCHDAALQLTEQVRALLVHRGIG